MISITVAKLRDYSRSLKPLPSNSNEDTDNGKEEFHPDLESQGIATNPMAVAQKTRRMPAQMIVKQWGKDDIAIASTTLGDLKKKIADLEGIPVDQQVLYYRASPLEEADQKTVDSLFRSECPIYLILKRKDGGGEHEDKEKQIFVKTLSGKTATIKVTGKTTVEDVLKSLGEFEGKIFDPGHNRLLFAGRQLENARPISVYGVDRECTLHLVLRLRGGACLKLTLSMLDLEGKLVKGEGGRKIKDPKDFWKGIREGLNIKGKCANKLCISQQYKGSKTMPILKQGFGVFRLSSDKPLLECPACTKPTLKPFNFLIAGAVSSFEFRKANEYEIKKVVLQSPGEFPKYVMLDEDAEEEANYGFIEVFTQPFERSSEECVPA